MKILHLITGGTISGVCPEFKEIETLAILFQDNLDFKKYIVDSFKIKADYKYIEICKKDSREILDIDRKKIGDEIIKNYKIGVNHFLITHGTYTMPDTGIFLEKYIDKDILKNISIIITGAMYPWNLLGSDAPMNIGASISSLLNTKKPIGVKICMHGKNRDVNYIKKDAKNLLFIEK